MIAEYDDWDATAMAAAVADGAVTPAELLDEALDRVAGRNPALNAVVLMQEDKARAAIAAGLPDGPLRGVPFLLKDLGCEAVDFPSHNGSRLLANTRYPLDSAIFERIRATGVVTFGRTTAPEGGVGPATEAAVYGGPTRNPWDLGRTPGGSSGGAGAAVAAGIVPAAHGSDGGGSVRIPASCCGLYGFKATRARLPDGPYAGEGWAGMAIDGFLTRSVRDSAALLDACEGADPGAPYWAPPLGQGYRAAIARPPRRLRIALCETTLTGEAIHPDCRDAVRDAAALLESLGHVVEPARPGADTRGRRCQTDSNRSRQGQQGCPLCHAKAAPLCKSGGAVLLENGSGGETAFGVEMVGDGGVDGRKLLQTSHAPEPLHRSLPSSERQVGILGPVVEPPTRFLPVRRADLLQGSAVRAELVRYKNVRATEALH